MIIKGTVWLDYDLRKPDVESEKAGLDHLLFHLLISLKKIDKNDLENLRAVLSKEKFKWIAETVFHLNSGPVTRVLDQAELHEAIRKGLGKIE